MRKYKRQLNSKYEEIELIGKVVYHDTSVCVSIDGIVSKDAQLIGVALMNAMVCQQCVVEKGTVVEIWLEDFDYGRYDNDTFEELLIEVCKEFSINLNLYN